MRAEIIIVAVLAAEFHKLFRPPGIGADKRHGDAQPLGLLDLQRHFAVIVGQKNNIRLCFFDFGQLG
jgi:hypothetical protein